MLHSAGHCTLNRSRNDQKPTCIKSQHSRYHSEHSDRFRKWASTKANAILNSLEIVFWLAVLVVTGKTLGGAYGAAAALGALTLILAIILEILSIWMAGCSIKVHRRAKALGSKYGATASPVYAQAMPKSHGYPPSSMQERQQV
ncbi:hypothetical protein Q7P37_008808 [Cladosporium fusiforme]